MAVKQSLFPVSLRHSTRKRECQQQLSSSERVRSEKERIRGIVTEELQARITRGTNLKIKTCEKLRMSL